IQYKSLSPDNYWEYSGKDRVFKESNFRQQKTIDNQIKELYFSGELEDKLNNGLFTLSLYSPNTPDSNYMCFDNNGNIIGYIMLESNIINTLITETPISMSSFYNNIKFGDKISQNIRFKKDPNIFQFNKIFIGFETVVVNAGNYENCVKFLTKYNDGSYSISYYAKNIGEVKYELFNSKNSKVDYYELTDFYIDQDSFSLPLSEKEWTIMYYACADDTELKDITEQIIRDELLKFVEIGSDENLNIIYQMEPSKQKLISGLQAGDDYFETNFTVYIEKNNLRKLRKNISLNVGDPSNLVEYVNYCKTNFPAKKYALIIYGHGGGSISWNSSHFAPKKVIGFATTYDDFLTYTELNYAFNEIKNILGKKLDLTVFSSCLMSTIELAYELKDYTNYIVASKFASYGMDSFYSFSDLKNNINSDGKQLGKYIIDGSHKWYLNKGLSGTFSLINPLAMDEDFMCYVDNFIYYLSNSGFDLSTINGINNPSLFESKTIYAQIDFFKTMEFFKNSSIDNIDLKNTAINLLNYERNIIPYKKITADLSADYEDSGISILWPYFKNTRNWNYTYHHYYTHPDLEPKFNKDTGWATLFENY
ncbi:MAG: clostripain-related cysteine peptidase, partial [Candidatus Muirbacterium halophilum]|nr:clostripain-related cysteine peptidase [Candidatus Muirbacterium halophilum]